MGAVLQFPRRLEYAWKRHGWRLFGPLIWHNIVYAIGRIRGTRGMSRASEIDLQLGIETHRIEATALLNLQGDNGLHGHGYQPVDERPFREAMMRLDIDHCRYTFIDFGSGKGRALLLATAFPFPRIIGVEYAREMHDVAVRNIERAKSRVAGADRIELVWADATRFELPSEPLVCFLHNPFDGTLMRALLDHLAASMQSAPRDIVIAYVHPVHRDVSDSHPAVDLLASTEGTVLYRLRQPRVRPDLARAQGAR